MVSWAHSRHPNQRMIVPFTKKRRQNENTPTSPWNHGRKKINSGSKSKYFFMIFMIPGTHTDVSMYIQCITYISTGTTWVELPVLQVAGSKSPKFTNNDVASCLRGWFEGTIWAGKNAHLFWCIMTYHDLYWYISIYTQYSLFYIIFIFIYNYLNTKPDLYKGILENTFAKAKVIVGSISLWDVE